MEIKKLVTSYLNKISINEPVSVELWRKYSLENSGNDYLIPELIKDPLYDVRKDGSIWTKLTVNGQGVSDKWREMGYQKADGYIRLRYKDEFLFAHRIIFWKFKGKIPESYTIDHKDQNRSNNSPDNLMAKTQGENNKNKSKTYKKKVASVNRSAIITKVMNKLSNSIKTRIS